MCTTKDGTRVESTESIPDGQEQGRFTAKLMFDSDNWMYKKNDYRCLKPNSSSNSSTWAHYDMKGFREAKTKEELEKVKEVKYDKYFFNFEDPKVFKKMTDKEKGPKLWRRTFGFDFVSLNYRKKQPIQNYECKRFCFKASFQKFARKCSKGGGVFKCIYARYSNLDLDIANKICTA